MALILYMPDACKHCGCENMKFHGTRTQGKIQAELRCMRCGRILHEPSVPELDTTP